MPLVLSPLPLSWRASMPKARRERRERTDNYHLLQQWCRTPEQRLYEGIRPVVLFGIPPAERAQETGLAERSLGRAADAFDTHGIISLFRPTKGQREDHHRSLPVAMRQLIVDLKAEYADFTDGEINDGSRKACWGFLTSHMPIPANQVWTCPRAISFAKSKKRTHCLENGECMLP